MSARVLVIHDQKLRQDQIKSALCGTHDVTIARDAIDGMTLLKQLEDLHLDRPPLDLIISCVHIEHSRDMTVFDLLKWAKGNPQMAKVPFVLICSEPSSMAQSLIDSVRLAGHSLGASGYLIIEKFDPEKFLAQIEYYLPEDLRSLPRSEKELEEVVMDAAPDAQNSPCQTSEAAATEERKRKLAKKPSRKRAEAADGADVIDIRKPRTESKEKTIGSD